MEVLRLDGPLDETLREPVLALALDGWTDAGRAGSLAAETIRHQWLATRIGGFAGDRLFDYRDRRPILTIDRGILGDPEWPALDLYQVAPIAGRPLLLVEGAEPDLGWRALCADVVELAQMVGARRYVGLGAVPAPAPHTRTTRLITTGSSESAFERYGRPHERLTVPASCQVVVETALRDAGLETIGLWARVPHYIAGEYPDGAMALVRALAEEVGAEVDLSELAEAAEEHRQRLDQAAASSQDIVAHIRQLEDVYDTDLAAESGFGALPTGDEIAAELERFLRRQGGGDR